MIADIGKRAAASFGPAGFIAAAFVFLVLLPLDLLAVTRLTGWEWGAALAAVLAINLVPLAGQLVYFGLAVVGAFTLGQDNLAQRRAIAAAPQSAAQPAADRPIDKFADWKKTVAAPAIQQSCLEDVQRRGLTGQMQIDQMARACACYGAAAEIVITPADVEDQQLQPSPGFNERLATEARRICQG